MQIKKINTRGYLTGANNILKIKILEKDRTLQNNETSCPQPDTISGSPL